jgi:hypothetical protein
MAPHLADPRPARVDQAHSDVARSLGHALVDLVAREPGQLAAIVDDDDLGLAVREAGEGLVTDVEQLVLVAHRAGSTRTLRKRHGAAP